MDERLDESVSLRKCVPAVYWGLVPVPAAQFIVCIKPHRIHTVTVYLVAAMFTVA